ncbi:MAG: haloacid dehalogenase type II [Acidimicrobiia bacterium]|nr:haloacid dehalogenase type II [Acidimicrobiia bacterium]
MNERPDIIVFDVNETLLSLSTLRPGFVEVFGTADLIGEWFARMLHGSVVSNELGDYRSFGTIGVEAMFMLAHKHGIELSHERAESVVAGMRRLEPHPDVGPALESLRAAGFRTATLTNGSTEAASAQLDHAGLTPFLDESMTVDEVRRFKPAREVYEAAADRFGVEISGMLMVAAHDWDIAGAAVAGCRTAFVLRPGVSWTLPGDPPDLVIENLNELVEVLTHG